VVNKRREMKMKSVIDKGKQREEYSLFLSKSLPQLKLEIDKKI